MVTTVYGITGDDKPFIALGDLDFFSLRKNLVSYLEDSNVFTDYDFTGSALSTLLDLLAYNSTLYGFYASMIANESFLDTAQLDESVYSLVKPLGYLPTSRRGAVASITVSGTSATTRPGDLYLGGGLKWTPTETFAVDGNTEIDIYQGQFIQIANDQPFEYSEADPRRIYPIRSEFIDTTTLKVFVAPPGTTDYTEWSNANNISGNITGIQSTEEVFFLTTTVEGNYAIQFGDNFIGKRPANGSLIRFDFYETSGTEGNGIAAFTSNTTGITFVRTNIAGVAGANRESIESVRSNAPLYFQTQGRYVTARDHRVGILQEQTGLIASVWGGEENDPPNYGRVYVSAIGQDANGELSPITESQKEGILSIMRNKGVVTILPAFIEPQQVTVSLVGNVFWNPIESPSDISQITSNVTDYINSYGSKTFESSFLYPEFAVGLRQLDSGLVGDTLTAYIEINVPQDTVSDTIFLRNRLSDPSGIPGTVVETPDGLTVRLDDGSSGVVFIIDDGFGLLKMYDFTDFSFIKNVGSVDYQRGRVQLNGIFPTDPGGFTLRVRPQSNTVIARGNLLLSTAARDVSIVEVG